MVVAFEPPAVSLAAIVSDIAPADPPVFGRMVAFHVVDETLVIVIFQAVRPGWRMVTVGVVDSPSAVTAVIVKLDPRAGEAVEVVTRNASASTLAEAVADWVPFEARTTNR